MPTDFYDVLGASADASSTELKRAYRAQVREYHPDVNDHPDGDEQFKLIREAHEVLSNPAERKDYDRMGHREYVDKRLDDLPPLTVFPEAEGEETADSPSETSVDQSGSVRSDSRSTESDTGSASSSRSTSTSTSSSSRSSSSRSSSSRSTSNRSSSSRSSSSGSTSSRSTSSSSSSSRSTSSRSSSGGSSSSRSTESAGSASGSGSTGTGRSTPSGQSDTSGRSRDSPSAGAERSNSSWEDVTEQTARSRSTQSSTSAAARRRRGLRRWYGVVLLSLVAYLAGIGWYAAPHRETLRGVVTALSTTPVATVTAPFPLPSPTAYLLGTATAAAAGEPGVGLLFLVGAVALPLVVLTAVAQFGHGSAWIYALASLGPVLPLVAERVAALSTALALVGLVVLPLFSGLGFLIDVGRYLYATR